MRSRAVLWRSNSPSAPHRTATSSRANSRFDFINLCCLTLQFTDGHGNEKQVAIKRLKTGHTDTDSRGFHQEIEALKTLGPHKYIVSFVPVLAVDC